MPTPDHDLTDHPTHGKVPDRGQASDGDVLHFGSDRTPACPDLPDYGTGCVHGSAI